MVGVCGNRGDTRRAPHTSDQANADASLDQNDKGAGPKPRPRTEAFGQFFWIWSNDSSTGVSRPKISTRPLTFFESGLISLMVACRVANGPSVTVTESPTSKSSTWTSTGLPGTGHGLLGRLALHVGGEHLDDLVQRQRVRVVGVADEAGDTGGVAHDAPGLRGEVHPDQDVAGELVLADGLAVAVLDLDDLLLRHLGLEDVVLDVQGDGALLQVLLHAVLVTRVGVDHVPLAGGGAQLLAELGDRVDLGLLLGGLLGLLGALVLGDGLLGDVLVLGLVGLLVQRGGLGGLIGLGLVERLGLVLVTVHGVHDLLGGLGVGGTVSQRSRVQLGGDIRLADGLVGVVQGDSDTVAASFLEMVKMARSGPLRRRAALAGAQEKRLRDFNSTESTVAGSYDRRRQLDPGQRIGPGRSVCSRC